MRILVTGATGFIGRSLVASRVEQGDQVVAISRNPEAAKQALGIGEAYTWGELTDALAKPVDAIVHLAGESVKGYWTKSKVEEVWESRVRTTSALVEAIEHTKSLPSVMISASGIGYYGDAGEAVLGEAADLGTTISRACVWNGRSWYWVRTSLEYARQVFGLESFLVKVAALCR